MDIGMPKMDGYEATRRIRALPQGQDVLIVALTGFASDYDRTRAHAAGVDLYLVKPVDLRFIESYVGNAQNNR